MRIAAPLIYSGEAGTYDYFETISDAAGSCCMCGADTLPGVAHACSNPDGQPRPVEARGVSLESWQFVKAFHAAAVAGDAAEVERLRRIFHGGDA